MRIDETPPEWWDEEADGDWDTSVIEVDGDELARIVRRIRELGSEQPERTARCVYVDESSLQPVCIVGQALVDLWNGEVVDALARSSSSVCELLRPTDGDDRSVTWLGRVQARQDEGYPWGEAVTFVDRMGAMT